MVKAHSSDATCKSLGSVKVIIMIVLFVIGSTHAEGSMVSLVPTQRLTEGENCLAWYDAVSNGFLKKSLDFTFQVTRQCRPLGSIHLPHNH